MPRNPHLPKAREDLNEVGAHCPTCGAEYRPGFDTCADDGTTLVSGPAPESGPWNAPPPPEPPAIQTAIVCSISLEEAHLLRGRLESEGIPARVDPESWMGAYPPKIVNRSFDVIVPREHLDAARQIYEAAHAGD